MPVLGQLLLLAAFVASGYAAFACFAGWAWRSPRIVRSGDVCGYAAVAALTAVGGLLCAGLLTRDYQFAYVVKYTSRNLPWAYALSALWVGQAGSLLVWAWMCGVVALFYRISARRADADLRQPAFAVLMACLAVLVAVMVFGADPMAPTVGEVAEGDGLSPSLQHPAMLLHPPVVFLGYAGWTVPFALAMAMLLSGRFDPAAMASLRPWALFSWTALGLGILIGADWAYEELGWGGYWGWDPVENGSLIPWLTGTALIHAAMAWQARGALKKSCLALCAATFACCNFATFLTRSGIFGGVHAFSQSPVGWMFLALLGLVAVATPWLILRRLELLRPQSAIGSVWSREGSVLLLVFVLVLLAAAVLAGTAIIPLSDMLGRKLVLGPEFYNAALLPTGLVLLVATAAAPLLPWGRAPDAGRRRALAIAAAAGLLAASLAALLGTRDVLFLLTVALATATACGVILEWMLSTNQQPTMARWRAWLGALLARRRTFAGYVMHLGLAALAIGIVGSNCGKQQHEATLERGERLHWAGHTVEYVGLRQSQFPDKIVAAAELRITPDGGQPFSLQPSQQLYRRSGEWAAEVAIHADWLRDFYVILHGGQGEQRVQVSLTINPLMRWLWLSGWIVGIATLVRLWPSWPRRAAQAEQTVTVKSRQSGSRKAA